jgi:hypothetical protein
VFVLVTMYLPTGLVGLVSRVRTRLRERKAQAAPPRQNTEPPEAKTTTAAEGAAP